MAPLHFLKQLFFDYIPPFFLISLFLLLGGCSSVTTNNIIGTNPLVLTEEKWNGTWLHGNGTVTFKVLDSEKGLLQLVWLDDKNGKYVANAMTVQIMEGMEWNYLNVIESEERKKHPDSYLWGRVKKERNILYFWYPKVEHFKIAVNENLIKGWTLTDDKGNSYDESGVELSDSSGNIIALVEANEAKYFEWDSPIVLIKLQ